MESLRNVWLTCRCIHRCLHSNRLVRIWRNVVLWRIVSGSYPSRESAIEERLIDKASQRCPATRELLPMTSEAKLFQPPSSKLIEWWAIKWVPERDEINRKLHWAIATWKQSHEPKVETNKFVHTSIKSRHATRTTSQPEFHDCCVGSFHQNELRLKFSKTNNAERTIA